MHVREHAVFLCDQNSNPRPHQWLQIRGCPLQCLRCFIIPDASVDQHMNVIIMSMSSDSRRVGPTSTRNTKSCLEACVWVPQRIPKRIRALQISEISCGDTKHIPSRIRSVVPSDVQV